MQKSAAVGSQIRGRPSAQRQRHVIQDLIEAAEHVLESKTAKEITVREISTAAGTNEAMIRYYFGSKEGLLVAMLDEFMAGSPCKDNEQISELCLSQRSIGPLVEALCDFYYSRPTHIRMIITELLNSSSEVKNAYVKRYDRSTRILVQSVISAMVDANIYRKEVGPSFVAMSLIRLIISPIMESAAAEVASMPREISNGQWAEYVTRIIDLTSRK